MRNDPRHDAPDVRAFLERMASQARIPSEDATPALRRAHRRAAETLVGAALVVAVVAAGGITALEAVRTSNRPTPLESQTPPPPTASPGATVTGRFQRQDLRGLVLRTSDRPPGRGLRHDPSYSEFNSLTQVASTLDMSRTELARAGFVTAYFNGFLSEDFLDPEAPPEERIDLVSYAILFPDAEAARAAFELFLVGPTTSQTEDWTSEPLALGEEGMTSNGLLSDVPTATVVWRVDNVVLFVASQGFAEAIPLDELLPLAERIDGRAA